MKYWGDRVRSDGLPYGKVEGKQNAWDHHGAGCVKIESVSTERERGDEGTRAQEEWLQLPLLVCVCVCVAGYRG